MAKARRMRASQDGPANILEENVLARSNMEGRRASPPVEALGPRAAQAETFLKAMANRHRLMILCELHKGERSVTELQQAIGLAQSALSQHLARLREEKIVATRRQSQTIFYKLADDTAARLIALLYEAYCTPDHMPPAA